MDEETSQEQMLCGCHCGNPLESDPENVKEVTVEGKPILVNITCHRAAYGKKADETPPPALSVYDIRALEIVNKHMK